MMNVQKQTYVVRSASPNSVAIKLAGLFALGFAFFFVVFFGYEMLMGVADRTSVSIQPGEEKPIVVDPKIADDLAKVLATDDSTSARVVKDPFNDRGGLSGRFAAAAFVSGGTQSTVGTAGGTAARTVNVGGSGNTPMTSGGSSSGGGRIVSPSSTTPILDGTKERYETWIARLAGTGEVPMDPRVFSIEDLMPVGVVDGGSGQQEVMFFSQAVGKTISFPVGTMFYDGWLTELRPEGVVFSSNDNRRIIRMRSWARSVRSVG